jgi:hypothetical protein
MNTYWTLYSHYSHTMVYSLDEANKAGLAHALARIILNRQRQHNFQLVCITHDEVCVLFGVLLFTVYCLLFIVYCLLFIVYCLFYCLLFIVSCLLFIVYCSLFIVYCLLFIVYCFFRFLIFTLSYSFLWTLFFPRTILPFLFYSKMGWVIWSFISWVLFYFLFVTRLSFLISSLFLFSFFLSFLPSFPSLFFSSHLIDYHLHLCVCFCFRISFDWSARSFQGTYARTIIHPYLIVLTHHTLFYCLDAHYYYCH